MTTTTSPLTADHLAARSLLARGLDNGRDLELLRNALQALDTAAAELGGDAGAVTTDSAASLFGYRWGFGMDPRGTALGVLGVLSAWGFVERHGDGRPRYTWTRTARPAAELDAAAKESIERTWRARAGSKQREDVEPGQRVVIAQPKVYGTGPSDTEFTVHFGHVTEDRLQPTDDRVPVRIDSGAVILYPPHHVAPVVTRKSW